MTTIIPINAVQSANSLGSVLLFGMGCICLGIMLIFALLTFISARHQFDDQHGSLSATRDDGSIFVGVFLCVIMFGAAMFFFAMAIRVAF